MSKEEQAEYERQVAILERMPWKSNSQTGGLIRRRDWEFEGQMRTIIDQDERPPEDRD